MGTLTTVYVPDIGDVADVPVIEILVGIGDVVSVGDSLVVIESEKATMDLPSSASGVLAELLVAVGDVVSEGTPIARVDSAEDAGVPSGDEEGEGWGDAPMAEAASGPQPVRAAAAEPVAHAPVPEVYAGPSARRRAREAGIDLTAINGSGQKGRVTVEDVERAIAGGEASATQPAAQPPRPLDFSRYGETERVALTKVQRASAANLARNWTQIPHVTHMEKADITATEAWRRQLNGEHTGVKVTMVALLLKAVAAALEAFPRFNASLDGDELVLKRFINLGFAADTPDGLVVPVVRAPETKGLLAVARELAELSEKARAGALTPPEMSGSTFTISSLGGIGGTAFTPIVNAPEVAILGVARSAREPVWNGDQFEPRLMLPLCLSYDHRVIDGAAAARFCVHLARLISDPREMLL